MYRSRDTTHALSPAWSGRTTPRRRRFLSALAPTLVGALIASVLTYAAVPRAAKHDVCPSVAPVILRTYEPAPPALSIEERIPAQVPLPVVMEEKPVPVAEPVQNATAWSKALKGAPTPQFRDNLLPDKQYITTFHDAGWTNQVIMLANMIYLGLQTQRTPILPPWKSVHHLGVDTGAIQFSAVFDVGRLQGSLGIDLVEWEEVKAFPEGPNPGPRAVRDVVGCWSTYAAYEPSRTSRQGGVPEWELGLDISYTPVPGWATMGHDTHHTFMQLARLAHPATRARALGETGSRTAPAPQSSFVLAPDEQLLCFDFMYFVVAEETYEWEHEWSPMWHTVLKHMRWTAALEEIRDAALRTLLGVSADEPIPPFIAVHVRHGDFAGHCPPDSTPAECFTPLADYAAGVADVRARILDAGRPDATRVIVASDEQDPAWWAEVAERGWTRADHGPAPGLDTAAQHGKWFEVFVDAAVMAAAAGFVGTESSTMSLLALRRVQDWNGGFGVMVRRPQF